MKKKTLTENVLDRPITGDDNIENKAHNTDDKK